MTLLRSIVLTLALSTLAAALGVWVGDQYVQVRLRPAPGLHEMLHHKLRLTAEQQRRLNGLERDHAAKSEALKAEMRAANAQLAQAYQESHEYTPRAQAAIDRFHQAMDALQRETLLHVVAMRRILAPDQTARFDDTVVKSLTDPAQ